MDVLRDVTLSAVVFTGSGARGLRLAASLWGRLDRGEMREMMHRQATGVLGLLCCLEAMAGQPALRALRRETFTPAVTMGCIRGLLFRELELGQASGVAAGGWRLAAATAPAGAWPRRRALPPTTTHPPPRLHHLRARPDPPARPPSLPPFFPQAPTS